MNRNTRIFLYGVVLLGVGILILYRNTEPQDLGISFLGFLFGIIGLALSGDAAFRPDR